MALKNFIEGLPETGREQVTRLAQNMSFDSAKDRIAAIHAELAKTRIRIDETNRKRNDLWSQLSSVDETLKALKAYADKTGDTSSDILMMRAALSYLSMSLRREIDTLRPDDDLAMKHDLADQLNRAELNRDLASVLAPLVRR